MSNYLNELIKVVNNPYATLAADGVPTGDITSFVDTGSYILNALISADIYGGFPQNKIISLAGQSGVGKSFIVLSVVKNFLDSNPSAVVIYFESESAITKQMLVERNIDLKRFLMIPVTTVQEFRNQAVKILDNYTKQDVSVRHPMMMVLDSLGMLSSDKEVEDMTEGTSTVDMTRAKLIRGAFRVLTLKLSKANIPLVITNHTYTQIGNKYPQEIAGGGDGIRYSSGQIIFLSRMKKTEGDSVVGHIIHCKNFKNRLAKENKIVDILLTYNGGLNKYYGLSTLAVAAGIFKQSGKRIELPDGSKVFESRLYKDPEKYYNKDILDKINDYVKVEFAYGKSFDSKEIIDEVENDTEV